MRAPGTDELLGEMILHLPLDGGINRICWKEFCDNLHILNIETTFIIDGTKTLDGYKKACIPFHGPLRYFVCCFCAAIEACMRNAGQTPSTSTSGRSFHTAPACVRRQGLVPAATAPMPSGNWADDPGTKPSSRHQAFIPVPYRWPVNSSQHGW